MSGNQPQGSNNSNKDESKTEITLEQISGLLDDFGRTIDKRFGDIQTQFEGKLAELSKKGKEIKAPEGKKPDGETPKESPELSALKEQMKALEDRANASDERAATATQKAIRAQLRSELDRVSNGKLATNAEELIKKEFLSLAQLDLKKESATFEVNGKQFTSVGEAFEKWIALDAHAGYRAPPPGSQVQSPIQPHVLSGFTPQQDEFGAELAKAGVEL